ncbi:substrate-binding periplasmic protein [Maridesulfovibrio sp.]|uniref:substrate-binding periplasmic protein n=1 Tax=unclassified Maridesulfovibrio TaxID=2794999 RepID=UPI003B003040
MRVLPICVLAVLFIAVPPFVCKGEAETLRVMLHAGSFPPYYFSEGDPRTGIVQDVFNAFAKETGDNIKYVRCPFNRSLRNFETGAVDIEPMSNPAWRKGAKVLGVFSKPFAVSESIVLFNKKKAVPLHSVGELKGKVVGVVRGYVYPVFAPYFDSGEIRAHVLENENKLIQMLLADRIDQALMNKDFALYQIKRLNMGDLLTVSKPYDSFDMMVRFHPSKKDAVGRFNKAIDKFLRDGTIENIYDQYR